MYGVGFVPGPRVTGGVTRRSWDGVGQWDGWTSTPDTSSFQPEVSGNKYNSLFR